MNNQVVNKILIISLIVISLLIVYRLIKFNFRKPNLEKIENEANSPVEISSNKSEDYKLSKVSRDPFLNRVQIRKQVNNVPVKKIIGKDNTKKTNIWPVIGYFGFLKNETKKNRLILLSINNNLNRIREGDKQNGLLVRKAYKDSVILNNGFENRMFLKKK